MPASVIVEREVRADPDLRFPDALVAAQINLFVLDAPPQPLHEYVVQRPTTAIHADRYSRRLQPAGERLTCELAPLVRVEHLRPRTIQGLVERSKQKLPSSVLLNRQLST